MFRLLAQHPDVRPADVKEPHYFCTDFHEESDRFHGRRLRFPVRTEAEYLSLFPGPPRRVVIEATTAYLRSAAAPDRIRAFEPDARILVMVREPVEMLRSLHAKYLAQGLEDIPGFVDAIAAEADRRAGRRMPATPFWPSSLFYSEWIRTGPQIERYRSVFPPHRLKVVVYDDFRRDNLAAFADVARFLDLDAAFRPTPVWANEHHDVRVPGLVGSIGRLGNLPAKHLLPEPWRRRVRRSVRRLGSTSVPRPPLDLTLQRELQARFRPQVESLGRVLDRDLLGLWAYPSLQ